jgi:hypothetical protein
MTVKFSYIAIFAGGLILGALAQYGLGQVFSSQAEKTWRSEHGEDANHTRITAFQELLKQQGPPKDTDELTKQIETQLKIEELVIQSRAAQYASLTPFTSFGSSVGALLVALLGFIAGLIGKKRGAAGAPNP